MTGPVAVVGSAGQLGRDLMNVGRDVGVEMVGVDHAALDVTTRAACLEVLGRLGPAQVINCASFTHVDQAEDRPRDAFEVNALGALNVASAAHAVGARLVHVSTDYVFPGTKPAPADGTPTQGTAYAENDCPGPPNVYGVSKLAGEHLVMQSCPDALVVRVASLFGVHGARGKGGNFIETIFSKARAGVPLRVTADQWMTPTYTVHLAQALLGDDLPTSGLLHWTNTGSCTWHQFAIHALEAMDIEADVEAVGMADYPTRARRPVNSSLMSMRTSGVVRGPHWRDAVHDYVAQRAAHTLNKEG